jgi:hypothetical protein
MAKTIVIDTEVKGVDQAVSDINKIDNAVDKTSSKKISINIDSEKLHHNLKNVEDAGKNIKKVGEGIIGGFSLANGVIGSMGDSIGFTSEEIAEAQEKTEAFFGVMTSIKPVAEGAGAAFKILGGILKTNPLILLATIIGGIIVSFLDMGAIVDGIKKGFKVFGDAVSATFDFIVDAAMFAIDMYTQFLDIVTFGLLDINGAYKGYVKSVESANAAERQRQENLEKERIQIVKNITELKNKSKLLAEEIKIIEKQKAVVTDRYDREIRMAQASGKDTYNIEQQKLNDLIEFTRKEIELKLQKYKIDKALQGEQAKFTKNLLGEEMAFISDIANDTKQKNIKANNEKVREIKALQKELVGFEDQTEENKLKKQKENYDKWKEQEEEKTAKAKEEAEKRKAWEDQVNSELKVIESKKSDNYLVGQQSAADATKNVWASMYSDIAKRSNETATKDLAYQKEVNNAKVQMLSDTLGTLSSLTELFGKKDEANAKKAFQVNKAISIADAIIKTYLGANAIFATAAANPKSVLFPAQPFIAAGLAIAGGFANVAKISATQFGGGGSASGGGGDSGFGSGASLPTVDTSSTPFQFPTAGQNNPQSNQQTFVSVTEINNVNNRVQVAEANATFG